MMIVVMRTVIQAVMRTVDLWPSPTSLFTQPEPLHIPDIGSDLLMTN